MYKDCTVGVVIPAFNEEGFIREVIETLPDFVDRAYVVDDCSTDGTWEEIQDTVASIEETEDVSGEKERVRPVIEPIRHGHNRGVGAAIATGYRQALADGMDVTAVMNGDGQMDPEILDRIIDPVVEGRAEYAKGNRLLSREHVDGMSAWRRFGNAMLTALTKIASGYWKTMDSQNGYTAISGRALAEINLDSLYDGYGFCNDILVRLNALEMRVADVEMKAVYGDETSTIRYHRFIPRVSKLLLDRFIWRLKVRYLIQDFNPLVGLYLVGTVTSTIGVASMVKGALSSILGRDDAGSSLEFSTILGFLGFVSALGAMTLDMKENEKLEGQFRLGTSKTASPKESATTEGDTLRSIREGGTVSEKSPASIKTIRDGHVELVAERTNGEITTPSEVD